MPRSTLPSTCTLTPKALRCNNSSLLVLPCIFWFLLILHPSSVWVPTVSATGNATVVQNTRPYPSSRLNQLALGPFDPTGRDARSRKEVVNTLNPIYTQNVTLQRRPWHGDVNERAFRKHGMQYLKPIATKTHHAKARKKAFRDSGQFKQTVTSEPSLPAANKIRFPKYVVTTFKKRGNFTPEKHIYKFRGSVAARQNRTGIGDNTFNANLNLRKFFYSRYRNFANSLLINEKTIRNKLVVSDHVHTNSTETLLIPSNAFKVKISKRSADLSSENHSGVGKQVIVNNIKPVNNTDDNSSAVGLAYVISEISQDERNKTEALDESKRLPEGNVSRVEPTVREVEGKSHTTIRSVGDNDGLKLPTGRSGLEEKEHITTPADVNSDGLSTVLATLSDEEEEEELLLLLEPTENGFWMDGLGNMTVPGNGSVTQGNCTEWTGGHSTTFQVGNLLYLTAFLVPHSFRASALITRCLFSIALVLFCLWAAMHLCALDVLLWCLVLLAANLVHAFKLGYVLWPARIQPELWDLYDKLFRPLKVARVPFAQLAREGEVGVLPAGSIYAEEELTPAATKLTVLLSGRLSVSCDSTHLHYIFPNQFVDSPEWEANVDVEHPTETFQVTVVADEDCTLMVWPREAIRSIMADKRSMRTVLLCLIGKDITTKLYSLTEQHHQREQRMQSRKGRSSPPLLLPGDRTVPARSISVDAVHTTQKGLVRSSAWRAIHQVPAHAGHPLVKGYSPRIQWSPVNALHSLPPTPPPPTPPRSPHRDHSAPRDCERAGQTSQDTGAGDIMPTLMNGANTTDVDNEAEFKRNTADEICSDLVKRKEISDKKIPDNSENDSIGPCRRSVVRLVPYEKNVLQISSSSSCDENAFACFSHVGNGASTLNLLDDPDLTETAV